jgi:cell shape-determining protein MreD
MAFLHSLPFPVSLLPFILIFTVYFYQYIGLKRAAWWLLFEGLFIDLFSLSPIKYQVLCYAVAAIAMTVVSTRVFTNRSFYGMSGTTVSTIIVLYLCFFIFGSLGTFMGTTSFHVGLLGGELLWTLLMNIIFVFLFFPFAKRFKRILQQFLPI